MRKIALAILLSSVTNAACALWFEVVPGSLDACRQIPDDQTPEQVVQQRATDSKVFKQKRNLPDGATQLIFSTTINGEQKQFVFASMHGSCMALANLSEQNSAKQYQSKIIDKYRGRIYFKTQEARKIVTGFNIDCGMPDGRYLPLINLLSARLQQMDSPQRWLETIVDSRDGDVRISDILREKSGATTEPRLSFQINKWGELMPVGITAEAILNSCRGSVGSIWVRP